MNDIKFTEDMGLSSATLQKHILTSKTSQAAASRIREASALLMKRNSEAYKALAVR